MDIEKSTWGWVSGGGGGGGGGEMGGVAQLLGNPHWLSSLKSDLGLKLRKEKHAPFLQK